MGNTCKPMAVSFQCMTKSTTNKKKEKKEKKRYKKKITSIISYLISWFFALSPKLNLIQFKTISS